MSPWNDWYHTTAHTYGTWLRGDARGWRARHHREHVDGDYRNPPPKGKYDALYQYSKSLMKRDPEFRQLYQRHRTLDKKVMDAELGVLPIDDLTLGQMKREKLHAKEKLLRIYDRAH